MQMTESICLEKERERNRERERDSESMLCLSQKNGIRSKIIKTAAFENELRMAKMRWTTEYL